VSARERRWFWATMPSKTLAGAVIADVITGTVLTFVGLPGLLPLPWRQKALIGSAATVAFSAAAKVMEYFIQEIEEPANKKSDKLLPEDKLPFPESAGSEEGTPSTRR